MKDEKLAREQIADNGKNNKTKFPVYDDIPTKKKKKITSASQSLSTRQLMVHLLYSTFFHESVKLPNLGSMHFAG